ncbi:hypothetical protein A2U01_0040834, partial [Trifolium medium]|nr:hypothetical protein [Trifolium medium]
RASKPVVAKPQTKYIEKDNTSKAARPTEKEAEIARKDNIVEETEALNITDPLNSEPILTPVNLDAEQVNNDDVNSDVDLDDENTIVIHDSADDAIMNKLTEEEATVLDTIDNVIPATQLGSGYLRDTENRELPLMV